MVIFLWDELYAEMTPSTMIAEWAKMSVVTVFDGLVSRLFDGLPVSTSRALWRAREAELATRS
jgi:hypothetical protein